MRTKSNKEVSYTKIFFSCCIQDGLQLCTYDAFFVGGVIWRHNRAQIYNRVFGQFRTSLSTDSVDNASM